MHALRMSNILRLSRGPGLHLTILFQHKLREQLKDALLHPLAAFGHDVKQGAGDPVCVHHFVQPACTISSLMWQNTTCVNLGMLALWIHLCASEQQSGHNNINIRLSDACDAISLLDVWSRCLQETGGMHVYDSVLVRRAGKWKAQQDTI